MVNLNIFNRQSRNHLIMQSDKSRCFTNPNWLVFVAVGHFTTRIFHSWEKLKGRNFTAQFFEFAKPFGKIFGAHPEQKKLRASLVDTNSVRRASLSNMCQPISIFQDKVVMMCPNLIDSKLRQFVLTFGLTSWHSLGVYWDTQFVNNNLFLQTFEMW